MKDIKNGYYISNDVLEAKLDEIEIEVKHIEQSEWPERLESSWNNATQT